MKTKNWKVAGFAALFITAIFATSGCSVQPQTQDSAMTTVPAVIAPNADAVQQQPVTPQTPTQTPPSAVLHDTLSYGSSGTDVANMQQFLADEGLYFGKDSGIFDQATYNAVVAFENQQNLTTNGSFGIAEQNAANSILAQHPDWVTTLSNNNEYKNVNGSPVQSPAYSSNGIPAGATAVCGDGTYSFSMHRSGTCSHHGGVARWLN